MRRCATASRAWARYGDGVREGGGLRGDCGDGVRACGRCPYGADGDGESVDAGADVRWLLRTSGVRDYNDVALSLTLQWPRRASEKLWRQSSPAAARRSPRRGLEEFRLPAAG